MLIAIDYDDTYTRDPELWSYFIHAAQCRGHIVICVTMRAECEGKEVVRDLGDKVSRIIFTDRKAKFDFVTELGYYPSVWIDDQPNWILTDAMPRREHDWSTVP
jgi:hypothetical protein